ncbi:putative MFS-type transporter [Cyphellophora attinorum]|uniref:Putative MFS-type transporter n=1 Tax=Cyphellophora attinorum TaxID=1664694 RepID=A0A0N1NYV2_9EURO|nr:putative MFS-type transporter [Phialophora attinorum]KPI39815.1 putative MFS-type transporter [Phialophora attinorum]
MPADEHLSCDENGYLDFGPNDPSNPKNYSFARKCYITAVSIALVMNATFASSAPTGALSGISKEFHVSTEAAGLVTTMFLLGYCAGPLLWAPLSEFFGRRWISLGAFTLYLAFGFLCAFTPNFGGLIVGRVLTGTACSAALTNAPGIIADIWGPVARGNAMILFSVATFVGPALGPVVSGFLQLTETWRWTFYVLLWMAGATEVFLLTLPETFATKVLHDKARRLRKAGREHIKSSADDQYFKTIFSIALTRPWILLFDPINLFVALYYAVVYTLLYMLFEIYPIVFQKKRGWNAGVGGLPLIGVVIGACIGGLALFVKTQRNPKKDSYREPVPEDRLPGSMVGSVLFAVSIFWFSWTAEYNSIHWIVPTIAGAVLAMSILLIFVTFINYIVDSYLEYAASAVAANTVVRSACAAASPLFTPSMFRALGVGGAGSLVGGVAILLMPMPFVFYRYGPAIRARSRYARTDQAEKSKGEDIA